MVREIRFGGVWGLFAAGLLLLGLTVAVGAEIEGPEWVSSGAPRGCSALEFNGSNDFVIVTGGTGLDIRGSLTLSAWVKSDGDDDGQIIWRGDNQIARDPYMLHVAGGRMEFRLDVGDGAATCTARSRETLDNNWHLWAGVYDSKAGDMSLYRDGQLESTAKVTGGFDYDTSYMWNTIGAVDIGNWQHFKGMIDEVRVWNRALSAGEIERAAAGQYSTRDSDLVGYWAFNEGKGDIASDSSGNGNFGQLAKWAGNAGYIPPGSEPEDAYVQAAVVESTFSRTYWQEFDGLGDYVEVPDSRSLDLIDALTLEAWINFEEGGTYNPRIVSKGWTTHTGYEFALESTGKKRRLGLDGGSMNCVFSNSRLAAGRWYHVAVTYDGIEVCLYINGMLDQVSEAAAPMPTNDVSLNIGRNSETFADNYKGRISEVRIWNRARTADEIYRDMQRELTGKEDGLVACWLFGRESGETVQDISPNKNHGRIIRSPGVSPPTSKPAVKAKKTSTTPENAYTQDTDRDHFIGWYKLPNRRWTDWTPHEILPGPGKATFPVFKRDGNYYSVGAGRGFEVPLKECPEGLEWGLDSSMGGTKIGFDEQTNDYYIIIKDSVRASLEGEETSESLRVKGFELGEKTPLLRIDEPAGLLDPTGEPPNTNGDFVGWYQAVWTPIRFEIRKEGERYLAALRIGEHSETHELTPLADGLGFNMFRYNKTLKRFEVTFRPDGASEADVLRMPVARITPDSEHDTPIIGIPVYNM